MNETIKTIINRRSVRKYSPEQLKKEELDAVILAALHAPSAHNEQSWHFTVVQNKKIIDTLNLATKEVLKNHQDENWQKYGADENFDIFYNAPTIIVVSGEKSALIPRAACAAATQNILIAAESLNIGSCWIGLIYPLFQSDKAQEFINLLKIPQDYEPYYAITLGYKISENQPPYPRRDNVVNFV